MRSSVRFDVYLDRSGQWRWRLKAANGRIVADSGEGYTRKQAAARAAYRFQGLVAGARVKVLPGA